MDKPLKGYVDTCPSNYKKDRRQHSAHSSPLPVFKFLDGINEVRKLPLELTQECSHCGSRSVVMTSLEADSKILAFLLCYSKCFSISLQPNSGAHGCSDLTLLLFCLVNKNIIVSLKKMTAFFFVFLFEVYSRQFSFFLMRLIHAYGCILSSFNGKVFKHGEEKEKTASFSVFISC